MAQWTQKQLKDIKLQLSALEMVRGQFLRGSRTKPAIIGGYTFENELQCEGRIAELESYLEEAKT